MKKIEIETNKNLVLRSDSQSQNAEHVYRRSGLERWKTHPDTEKTVEIDESFGQMERRIRKDRLRAGWTLQTLKRQSC